MIQVGILCERLEWDSSFFGISIARALPTRVDAETCAAMLDWCRAEKIDCLYLLADEDLEAMRVLEAAAFSPVDERVTLELQPVPAVPSLPADTRPARESDIAALREIAAVSHTDSRFYNDGRFDWNRCDELYRVWIEKSCRGWADHVVVVERGGGAIGYLSLHLREPGSAMIGLIGVDPRFRREGIGTSLLAGALAWMPGRAATRLWLATQGRNSGSLRFYQNAGFRVTGRATWYHRWFSPSPGIAS
jgi:GNAT superfamily N-acetyltransferase